MQSRQGEAGRQASPEAQTTLGSPVPSGVTTIAVASVAGFQPGHQVIIDYGSPQQETNVITGFGSLMLMYPLQFSHAAGASVSMPAGYAVATPTGGQSTSSGTSALESDNAGEEEEKEEEEKDEEEEEKDDGIAGKVLNVVHQVQGHSKEALLGTALAGAGAAFLGSHLSGHGGNNNNGGSNTNGNSGNANSNEGGDSNRAFTEVDTDEPPFVFWTPSNPGTPTCRTDKPTRDFPGANGNASNAAWPSGHQPGKLECWPKDADGNFKACWYTKELFATDRGWPGKCQGLLDVDTDGKSCKESCVENPECPVWQTHWEGNGKLVCAQGRGRDCAGMRQQDSSINVEESQRIQHGSVRVLMSLQGMEIKNLRQDFDAGYYSKGSDATEACKFMCYSDIKCAYWLYSRTDGCFLEDPPMHTVPYPLTTKDVSKTSQFSKSVIAGEYIVHRCPENDGTFTSEDEHHNFTLNPFQWNWFAFHWPWQDGGWPWWGWILFIIGCCCCCHICVCATIMCGVCQIIVGRLRGGGNNKVSDKGNADDSDSDSSSSDSDNDRRYADQSSRKLQTAPLMGNQLAAGSYRGSPVHLTV
jgi:hypothetical protein